MEDLTENVESNIKYSFTVSYYGTEQNRGVHDAFREYARQHCDSSYILALQRLLELASTDWKYETLYDEIQSLKLELASLSVGKEEKKTSVLKTFGDAA